MKRYMAHLLKGAEIRTRQFLDSQVKKPESLQYGGIRGDIWEAKPTIYALTTALSVWLNEDSCFFHEPELYKAMDLALDFVARTQREDGSFDYPSCNFKSAPDTSFCFKRMYGAYRLLEKYDTGQVGEISALKSKYLTLIHRALEFIKEGGFHTPNHRWAIAAALLQGASLFSQEDDFSEGLRQQAGRYLAEGIDGDEYGEYAERSTGNYNAVVNNAMIAMFEETGNKDFLGYVKRNLNMMLTYIDPDDTIFTQNSTRQDRGRQDYADKYFYQYLYLCSIEENPVFDGAAHKIIKDNMNRGDLAPDCLHIVMAHEKMMNHEFHHYGFLEEYRQFNPNSGVLRVKRKEYTYTVMRGRTAFLYIKSGSLMVHVKIGESYCNIRNFIPEEILVENDKTPQENRNGEGILAEDKMTAKTEWKGRNRCILKSRAKGWYYLPFKEPQETSDWWKMDHTKRDKLINSYLDTEVAIDELDNGVEVTLKTNGLDRLPLRLEVCIPNGSVVEHPTFWLKAAAGESMILKDGFVTVRDGLEEMTMGPGFGDHEFQGHYSGEEINASGYTIYCNGYTPLEKKFRIQITGGKA